MKVKSVREVTQSCPTLSNPMDYSLPGSSIHGIFQARVLEWGAIAFSGRSCIQPAKTRPGADYGSYHQLPIAKFRLKLKKAGKTTRQARYDLNHIPYEYAVEVTNRFKGLELVKSMPEKLWTEVHDIVQEAVITTIAKKKKCKKAKWLSEETLQIAENMI